MQRGCNLQYTPKPLCEYGADGDGMYPVPCHYGDFCKPASENITPQPQSANSGFQGLGAELSTSFLQNVLPLHCLPLCKCNTFSLLATIVPDHTILNRIDSSGGLNHARTSRAYSQNTHQNHLTRSWHMCSLSAE